MEYFHHALVILNCDILSLKAYKMIAIFILNLTFSLFFWNEKEYLLLICEHVLT